MKVRLVSDGTSIGSKVLNAETGELIENVTIASVSISARGVPTAVLHFANVEMDVVAEVSEDKGD